MAFVATSEDEALDFLMELKAKQCYDTAEEKGFWPEEKPGPDKYLSKMMLLTSEVAEVMEAYRKQKGSEEILDEFADIFIRMLDLYSGMKQKGEVEGNLGEAIAKKMNKNKTRPRMHGNLA